jgi:Flp pilus assembly protein TadB
MTSQYDDEGGLGGKFWLAAIGVIVGGAIAAMIVFVIIDVVWYAWGGLGALLLVIGVVGAIAYVHDRREQRRYEELPE